VKTAGKVEPTHNVDQEKNLILDGMGKEVEMGRTEPPVQDKEQRKDDREDINERERPR